MFQAQLGEMEKSTSIETLTNLFVFDEAGSTNKDKRNVH